MEFQGYIRPDGRAGIRNCLLVISNGSAAGSLARMIAGQLRNARCYVPPSEFGREAGDRATIRRTLLGLAANPNVGAVLIVGMKPDSGYPELSSTALIEPIMRLGKHMHTVFVSQSGFHAAIGEGIRKGRALLHAISRQRRKPVDFGSLFVGVKCGYSDPTSGMAGNLAAGNFVDRLIDAGGTVVFGETTEVIGAEHLVARRFPDALQRRRFLELVAAAEEKAKATGQDIRSINPVPANIETGITTLEEKSLGAVAKSGSRPIRGCLAYAEAPAHNGLWFVDSWMATASLFLGFAAAGAVLNIFQMGGGWLPPHDAMLPGHNLGVVAPTMFMTGNPRTWEKAAEALDFNAGAIIGRGADTGETGRRLTHAVCEIASGGMTKGETLRCEDTLEIYLQGPTL